MQICLMMPSFAVKMRKELKYMKCVTLTRIALVMKIPTCANVCYVPKPIFSLGKTTYQELYE